MIVAVAGGKGRVKLPRAVKALAIVPDKVANSAQTSAMSSADTALESVGQDV